MWRRILKYDEFSKRDGSIISKVRVEEEIITDHKEVAKLLLEVVENIQKRKEMPPFLRDPSAQVKIKHMLPALTETETREILNLMGHGKGIAWDGIDDSFVIAPKTRPGQERPPDHSARILKDIWAARWLPSALFRTRMIFLNKVHPEVPRPQEQRPIAVMSPLLKLMEARFLPKLQDYLNKRLHRAQTGFVPAMGTEVNLVRMIKEATKHLKSNDTKTTMFILFFDFKSAYNTVDREKLYKILSGKRDSNERRSRVS